jgi:membrane protein YqaA with SNARE-associated domain
MSLVRTFEYHVEAVTKKAAGLINSRYGLWFLGILSFVESSLLIPLITDPFMAAYILVHRGRAVVAVVVTTVTSLLGGLVAYITAAFVMDKIFEFLSPETIQVFNEMIVSVKEETFIMAFLGALTPIPFTLSALAAGVIKGDLLMFMLGALAGRAIRYSIVGYLTYRYGQPALELAKKNIALASVITFIIVGIYIWIKM